MWWPFGAAVHFPELESTENMFFGAKRSVLSHYILSLVYIVLFY